MRVIRDGVFPLILLLTLATPAMAEPTEGVRHVTTGPVPVDYLISDSEHCDALGDRDIPCPDPTALARAIGDDDPVARWRPVVETYFEPDDVERAMAVIRCESTGDPEAANPYSTARGLFQHLESEWDRRLELSGWPVDTSIYDPVANTAVAAYLVYEGGGWSNWNASGHCW